MAQSDDGTYQVVVTTLKEDLSQYRPDGGTILVKVERDGEPIALVQLGWDNVDISDRL